jgi:hypothetical protein
MRRSSIMLIASALAIGIGSMTWAQTPVEGPSTKPAAETAANSASDPPVTPATPSTPSPTLQAEEAKTSSGDASASPASTFSLLRVTIDPELAKSKSGETMINRLKEVDFARLIQVDLASNTPEAADKNRTMKMSATLRVGEPVFLPNVLVVVEKIVRANVLEGIRIEPKTADSDSGFPTQPIAGTINATSEATYTDVAKALRALSDAGVMPVSFTPAAGATLSESAPFATSLLILEEDWSKSPTAKEVEADLRKVLESVGIPGDFRDQPLLASSPNILFSPENIGFYQPDHCAALIAWLQKHKLLKETIEFPAPSLDVLHEQRGANIAAAKIFIHSHRHYRDDAGRIPLHSTQGDQPKSPFSQSRLTASWSIDGNAETNIAAIQCSIRKLTQFRGQTELSAGAVLSTSSVQFELPENRVALVHGLGGRYGAYSYPQSGYRPSGAIPVLMIRRTAAPLPEQSAAVWIPDSVLPANSEPRRGGVGRSSAGRVTRREPDVQPVTSTQLQVIRLKHAQAKDTYAQLRQLMGGEVQITAEPRTNSILVNATKAQLDEITKFIANIDELSSDAGRPLASAPGLNGQQGAPSGSLNPPAISSGPPATKGSASGQFTSDGRSGTSIELRKQFEAMDRKTKALARDLKNSTPDRPVDENEKLQLRTAVADAFATRQKLQREELAELSTRLREMQQSLELRDRVQEQIIDRRVDDLLNRDLRWDTDSTRSSPNSQEAASSSSATQRPDGPTFTEQATRIGGKDPSANSQHDHPEEKSSDVKSDRSPDPALQGVWGIDFAKVKVDESTVPPENKIRLVFWGDRQAVFRGGNRTQLMMFTTEKRSPANWIVMTPIKGGLPTQGMYEVIGDGMRLSLSSDPKFLPDRFGTAHPEFIRISKDVPKEFLVAMQASEVPEQIPPSQSQAASNFSKDRSARSDSSGTNQDGLVIRSAEEFQRLIDEATAEQASAEQAFKDAVGKKDGVDSENLRREFPAEWARLTRAKRRFKIIHDELAAQRQLLRIDVETSESKLKAAIMEFDRTNTLYKQKVISISEVEIAQSKVDLLKLATMRSQTLFELYTKINQEPASDTPPGPGTGTLRQ